MILPQGSNEHQSKIKLFFFALTPETVFNCCLHVVFFASRELPFFVYLNCQIKSAKEQQDDVGAKLTVDYLALEEQINHFDVEVRMSLP